ncbi:MAG: hypothetical protein WCD18_03190 [Thermosynechococcaceae cyanobacterium]
MIDLEEKLVEKSAKLVRILFANKISQDRFLKIIESQLLLENYQVIKELLAYTDYSQMEREDFLDFMNTLDVEYIIEQREMLNKFADYCKDNQEILSNFSKLFDNMYIFKNLNKIKELISFFEINSIDINTLRVYKSVFHDYILFVHFNDIKAIIECLNQAEIDSEELKTILENGYLNYQFQEMERLLDSIRKKEEEVRATQEYIDYLRQNIKNEEEKLTEMLNEFDELKQKVSH